MGKSLNFVKNRITSGFCNGMENNHYEYMQEINLLEALQYYPKLFSDDKNVYEYTLSDVTMTDTDLKGNIEIWVKYDPDADFEYFTMERCRTDGTLSFFSDLIAKVINKVLVFQTYNKEKIPDDYDINPFSYKVKYVIGNPVISIEHGEKFATEEKPWMLDRFSAMLPIKMNFERKQYSELQQRDCRSL